MALLNDLNNEDCGCDNNFYSVINESPLLSGAQENSFNTTLENNSAANNIMANNLKNNNTNNMSANSNNKMNNMNMDISHLANNQQNQQNQQNQVNEQNIQNILNSIPDTNKRNNNQMQDMGAPRQNQEQIVMNNQLMNNLNNMNNSQVDNTSSNTKFISTHFNYVLVVVVALAINDLAKYYINRSIKFQNGTHTYYLYYAVGVCLVLYMMSKYVSRL
jgi:hypothetical protein